jgi:predicted phosphodiesterase
MKYKNNCFRYGLMLLIMAGAWLLCREIAYADKVTGGLSQITVQGTRIRVEGGVILEGSENRFQVRALSLSPRIILDSTSIHSVVAPADALPKLITEDMPETESSALTSSGGMNEPAPQGEAEKTTLESTDISPKVFEFEITNVDPRRIELEGEAQLGLGERTVSLKLNMLPEEIKELQLKTNYPNPDAFSFAVMGDSRGGDQTFKSIIEMLNKTQPLFAVNCGDLVNNGKRAEYRHFKDLISRFKYPFFFTVGNHDVLWWGRMVYEEYFGPTYYSFNYRQAHFIFLDNALGRIDDHQFRWLENDLRNNTKTYTFMFMHLPPFDPRPDMYYAMNSQLNAQRLMDLAAAYKVNRVFCGHIHEFLREERDGVVYIITGGAGAELRAPEAFFHYFLVTVGGEGIVEELVKLH